MGQKYKIREDLPLDHDYIQGAFRIEALRDFSDVKKGDIGGFVQSEHNLSHRGDCWIYEDAVVEGDNRISGNTKKYTFHTDFENELPLYTRDIIEIKEQLSHIIKKLEEIKSLNQG